MEKRISYDIFMSVKRVAQACNPLVVKRDRVAKKIEELQKEYDSYDAQISALEAGIKSFTGFRTEQLVKKVIEPVVREDGAPAVGKDGKPQKTTKYVPTDIVSYDKEHKEFVVTLPDKPADNAEEAVGVGIPEWAAEK